MKRDGRDPQVIGDTLIRIKELYPDMSACDRADLLEQLSTAGTQEIYLQAPTNGTK